MSIERYAIIGLSFAIALFMLNVYLFRSNKISAKMFTQWFLISIAIGAMATIPQIIQLIYLIIGTQYLATAFTGLSFLSLLLLIYYLQYKCNQLSNKLDMILPFLFLLLEKNMNRSIKQNNKKNLLESKNNKIHN